MKKRLNLKTLKVQSFVTDSVDLEAMKGGSEPISDTTVCLVNCEPCGTDGCGGTGGGDSEGIQCTEIIRIA